MELETIDLDTQNTSCIICLGEFSETSLSTKKYDIRTDTFTLDSETYRFSCNCNVQLHQSCFELLASAKLQCPVCNQPIMRVLDEIGPFGICKMMFHFICRFLIVMIGMGFCIIIILDSTHAIQ
jgi:hypothetical protein